MPLRHSLILAILAPLQFAGCGGARWAFVKQPVTPATVSMPSVAEEPSAAPPRDFPTGDTLLAAADATDVEAPSIALTAQAEISEPTPVELPIPERVEPVPVTATPTWSLAQLESIAISHNPSIRQASASAYKAIGYRDQVGTKPNPIVGYNGTQMADEGTDQHTAFVEQQFVLGDKLARNRVVLNQEVQSQLWEVEAQRYRVLTDVRRHYFEALAAQRRLELTREFHVIAAKGVDVAQARLDAKEGSVPELLQAEILLNQVDVQGRQAEAAFRGSWKQLMAVSGLGGTPPGVLDGRLPDETAFQELEAVKHHALASSPELQAARARVSRARAHLDRQQVQPIPNLSLLLAGGYDQGTNSGLINAQVGLPVPLFNRNEGNIAAAQAELCRACEEVRRIQLSIESRLAQASQEYEAAAAGVELYQQVILPKAEETLRLTEEAYTAGEFEFLQVLIVRKTYFETFVEYVRSQENLALAEASLQGMVLSGGLDATPDTEFDAGLRDQTLSGE